MDSLPPFFSPINHPMAICISWIGLFDWTRHPGALHGTFVFSNSARYCKLKGIIETNPPMLVILCSKHVCWIQQPNLCSGRQTCLREQSIKNSHQSSSSRVQEGSSGLPTALSIHPPRNEKQGRQQDFTKPCLHLFALGFFLPIPHGLLLLPCCSRGTPSPPVSLTTIKPNLCLIHCYYQGSSSCLPTTLYHRWNTWLLF